MSTVSCALYVITSLRSGQVKQRWLYLFCAYSASASPSSARRTHPSPPAAPLLLSNLIARGAVAPSNCTWADPPKDRPKAPNISLVPRSQASWEICATIQGWPHCNSLYVLNRISESFKCTITYRLTIRPA